MDEIEQLRRDLYWTRFAYKDMRLAWYEAVDRYNSLLDAIADSNDYETIVKFVEEHRSK